LPVLGASAVIVVICFAPCVSIHAVTASGVNAVPLGKNLCGVAVACLFARGRKSKVHLHSSI